MSVRADTTPAVSDENLEVVRRWWASFNEHGIPSLDLCDEQIEIRNPPDFPLAACIADTKEFANGAPTYSKSSTMPTWRWRSSSTPETARPSSCFCASKGRPSTRESSSTSRGRPCGESKAGNFDTPRGTPAGARPSRLPGCRCRSRIALASREIGSWAWDERWPHGGASALPSGILRERCLKRTKR